MHYVRDGQPIFPMKFGDEDLDSDPDRRVPVKERVQEVVPRVPETSWLELDDDPASLPLRYDTSFETIVLAALPHATGSTLRTKAVYVLECRHNRRFGSTAVTNDINIGHDWGETSSATRLLYVGVTVNLLSRLDQHLNSPGKRGANFTGVFPPMRILDVSWWATYQRAQRAEKLIADGLEDRFEGDYVAYPG
jgi:hypothetical protein